MNILTQWYHYKIDYLLSRLLAKMEYFIETCEFLSEFSGEFCNTMFQKVVNKLRLSWEIRNEWDQGSGAWQQSQCGKVQK